MTAVPRIKLPILITIIVSIIATISVVLAAPLLMPQQASGMGANLASCNNIYSTTFSSMTINNGTMNFDPITNPGLTFEAKNGAGYTVTYTLQAANQSLTGNTDNGSAFRSTTAFGNFVDDYCPSGFGPNLTKAYSDTIPYAGYQPVNSLFATESVFWHNYPQTQSITYNVAWYNTLNQTTSVSNTTPGSGTISNATSSEPTSNSSTSTAPINQTSSGSNTQITSQTTNPAAAPSSVTQQGTIATNATGFATMLSPSSSVYTGTISYTAGSSVELWILHAYGIQSSQNVSGSFSQPTLIHVNDQTYAVSVIKNAGSSDGQSGSTVFSGNGLMMHSKGPTIAVYTLKASIDTPANANNLGAINKS